MATRARSSAKKRTASGNERALKKEARRQALLANRSPHAANDRARVDEMQNPEMPDTLAAITDLIGSVKGLPTDLSANKKYYLAKWRYGRKKWR